MLYHQQCRIIWMLQRLPAEIIEQAIYHYNCHHFPVKLKTVCPFSTLCFISGGRIIIVKMEMICLTILLLKKWPFLHAPPSCILPSFWILFLSLGLIILKVKICNQFIMYFTFWIDHFRSKKAMHEVTLRWRKPQPKKMSLCSRPTFRQEEEKSTISLNMPNDYNISVTIWKYLQSHFEDLSNPPPSPFSNNTLNKPKEL